jgi:hypothetical protein
MCSFSLSTAFEMVTTSLYPVLSGVEGTEGELDWRAEAELHEQIRREYEFGVGSVIGVARKLGVHRRMLRTLTPLIGDHLARMLAGEAEIGVDARLGTGFHKKLLEEVRALRHRRCVLDDDGVAGHEVRGDEACQLVVREVPGFDADENANDLRIANKNKI